MQWRRGLFRLWIVLACLWATSAFAIWAWGLIGTERIATLLRFDVVEVSSLEHRPPEVEFSRYCAEIQPGHDVRPADFTDDQLRCVILLGQHEAALSVRNVALSALIPPIIVFLIGGALMWAIAGFRQSKAR